MKKLFVLFGLLLAATMIFAQAPQAFNYQAVVRDAAGNLLQNQAVGIKISLLQGSATGQEVYAETHTTNTNQFGQVDLKIGTGTVLTGQFDTIPWNTGNYHLQLSVDLSGGANYQIMGTTQMLSVPYALYAEEGSGWEKNEIGPYIGVGCVGLGIPPYVPNTSGVKLEVYGDSSAQIRVDSDGGESNRSGIIFRNKELGWQIGTSQTSFGSPGSLGFRTWTPDYYYNRLIIQQDGKVGIGTDNPATQLEVAGNIRITNGWRGLQLVNDDQRYDIIVGSSASGNRFGIWDDTQSKYRIYINGEGNVGIGTSNPTYPLTVDGTIRSKKVIVDTGWSDFVFEDDYSLMPLHQLDKFIEENKHLPEIPSAKEVEANGISLGEMDAKLLQKIEELTLYTIEQQKKIDELEKEVKKLNKRSSR